ncbi:MAG: PilZ domain-containing protein [Smithella sp.]
MKDCENRLTIRHRGAFPVKLENTRGVTRDFSSSGIFFETDESFAPGHTIEFTIVLEYVDPQRPVHLKCRGKIVRVENKDHKLGIAAKIKSYVFERSKDTSAVKTVKKTRRRVKQTD